MDHFENDDVVRLRGRKGRYLWANSKTKSIRLRSREDHGTNWRVEITQDGQSIRLISVDNLYLRASDQPLFWGLTGKKVVQEAAASADSSTEWVPVAEQDSVLLKTRGDTFLRGNGGMKPYKGTVTHDVPVLPGQHIVVLWKVEIVSRLDSRFLSVSRAPSPRSYSQAPRVRGDSTPVRSSTESDSREQSSSRLTYWPSSTIGNESKRSDTSENYYCGKYEYNSSSAEVASSRRHETLPEPGLNLDRTSLFEQSPPRITLPKIRTQPPENTEDRNRTYCITPGSRSLAITRRIFYIIADDNDNGFADADESVGHFKFKGQSLEELAEQLHLETGIDEDIVLCSRNPSTQKLHEMRLKLPPNSAPLTIYIVRANSTLGKSLHLQ